MIEQDQFSVAKKAMKKLYPDWMLFIDEVMDLLLPFWLGTQWKEQVHFIHLIGYGKRQKAREILTDLIELLDWESESLFLWQNWDINSPSLYGQAVGLQESFLCLPKVLVTDFLSEFFATGYYEAEHCGDFEQVKSFLRTRTFLELKEGLTPSDARGGLIISFLDSFGDSDFVRTRLMFQFLVDSDVSSFEGIRKKFVPNELASMMEEELLKANELIFFSKDEPRHVLLALELIKVMRVLERLGEEMIKKPVKLSFNAMDYFLTYVFYKKLSSVQLHRAAIDFFLPVFRQFSRLEEGAKTNQSIVLIDFKGGWKFSTVSQ